MSGVEIHDGDLVVLGGFTTGRLLEIVGRSKADVTVLVAGPTFDREYAGPSIREFAQETPGADIELLLPQGEVRSLIDEGQAAYIPSRSPDQTGIVRRRISETNRTIGGFETSTPKDGTITPGACGLFTPAILSSADVTVAEVNPKAPRLPGLAFQAGRFDHTLDAECELPRAERPEVGPTARQIGENVAELIPDGATVELGIGRISEAVARGLRDHTGLGVHSGLVEPTLRDLISRGVVTRGSLAADPMDDAPIGHPILANSVLGDDPSFYDWAAESSCVELGDMRKTTDPILVAANPKFTAINGALQVDIQGQVSAERAGSRQLGTAGGQPAYFRAARQSSGGCGIVTLPSQRADGASNVVATLADGGVVTTTRLDFDYVVTEYGAAELFGETLQRRTEALIDIAPPDERAALERTAWELGLL